MSDLLALRFILVCDTAQGPLYVQHLNAFHRVSSLSDDPAVALEFEAQACKCDDGYFIIEPRLHGAVWNTCRPMAILPLDGPPHEGASGVVRPARLWSTLARRLRTFASMLSLQRMKGWTCE
jgi:hypothetical protein